MPEPLDQPTQPADATPLSLPLHERRVPLLKRRWVRVLLALLLLIATALAVAVYNVTRPRNLARLASGLLSGMTGTQVDIHAARAGFDGMIHLTDVHLRIPDQEGPVGRFFDAKEVIIAQDLRQLIRGKFLPRKITVVEPSLFIIEDTAAEKYNYQILQQKLATPGATTQPRQLPKVLPEVAIINGRVVFGEMDAGQFRELGKLPVAGGLSADANKAGVYNFALAQQAGDGSGAAVSGMLDLDRLSVTGKIDRFNIQSPQRVVLPKRLQRWWDLLDPAGSLPAVSFGYDSDSGLGLYAILELKEGEISLPYGGNGGMVSRMTHVNGRFNLTLNSVQVENLTGQIEGLDYKLDGKVNGFDAEAPLKLVVQIKEFKLPQKPRYLPALPQGIQNHFYRFTPSGTFKALVMLERKKAGDPISYDGTVNLYGVKASYAKFPYPIEDLRGELRFNDDRVEIVSMKGRGPTGANVSVTGVIAPPREGAHVKLRIAATDVPVDEHLRSALSPDQVAIIDLVQDKPTYDAMLAKGLIQTPEQKRADAAALVELRHQLQHPPAVEKGADAATTQPAAAALREKIAALEARAAIPAFDLKCKANFTAEIERPAGTESRYSSTVYIDANGGNILLRQWPYPLRLTGGRVIVSGGRVVLEDVLANGLTGGSAEVRGAVEPPREGKGRSPRIQLVARAMPLDPLLLSTIPEPHDRWLRDLRLAGAIDCAGVIMRSPDAPPSAPIEFHLETSITDGKARPYGGAYKIDAVTGKVIIERGNLVVEKLVGRRGETQLTVTGKSGLKKNDADNATRHVSSFEVKATSIRLEDPLTDLLPPDVPSGPLIRELIARHKPTGQFDAELVYQSDAASPFLCRAQPRDLRFDFDGRPIELTDCKGIIELSASRARFNGWTAKLGETNLRLDGDVAFTPEPLAKLVVNTQTRNLCPKARNAVPPGLLKVIDGLKLAGGVNLVNAAVVYNPPGSPDAGLSVRGKAQLSDVSGVIGVKVRELAGDIDFDIGMASLKDKLPRLKLRMELQRFIAADRLVSPLNMDIVSGENPSELIIKDLAGDLYHGSIGGAGKIEVGDGGLYQLRLSISDADVGPLAYPNKYAQGIPDKGNANFEAIRKAKISASLDLAGSVDDTSKRTGRGRFDVTNVNLNQSPLATSIIQLVNLTLPTGEAFNHVLAAFLVDNDNINFEQIVLDSPSFSFIGRGRMVYSTQKLDLDFLAQARKRELVPLVAVWRLLLDQLINIHVSGTLDEPVARLRPLDGVRRSVDGLIGIPDKDQPGRRPGAGEERAPTTPNPPAEAPIRGGD